jgi:cobalt-zinc-cadmium efflux system protein
MIKHGHDNINNKNTINHRNLFISVILNFGITIVEVIGGIISNSLALVSDALHNLGDTTALIIAYFAHLISRREYTYKRTFGYKRIEILAALFNAIVLIVIVVYLFIEAFKRFKHPEPIKGMIMLGVALTGLLANFISAYLLKKDSKKNLNIKAAYLHIFGDTVSSFVVIISSILIYFYNIYWIDPLVTIFLGLYLLKETYAILRQSVDILMQGTPRGLDLNIIKAELESLPEISNIHHVHAWNLTDSEIHFECHVDLTENIRISDSERIRERIHKILLNKFGISHVTVQCEYNCCDDKRMIHQRH